MLKHTRPDLMLHGLLGGGRSATPPSSDITGRTVKMTFSSTEPPNPSLYDIWVCTDNQPNKVYFQAEEPTDPSEGDFWIKFIPKRVDTDAPNAPPETYTNAYNLKFYGFVGATAGDASVSCPSTLDIWVFLGFVRRWAGTEWEWVKSYWWNGAQWLVHSFNDFYVYAGSSNYCVRKLTPSGSQVWQYATGGNTVSSVAVDPDGYVYAGSTNGYVRKLTPSGSQVWSYNAGAGAGFVTINSGDNLLSPAEVKALYEANPNTNAFTDEEKIKLASVEYGANKYVHPPTHPASMIEEDDQRRFVTSEEKAKIAELTQMNFTPLNKAGDTMEGDLGVQGNVTVAGDILPTANGVQSIGSPSAKFKALYVEEAHLSTNTLYIGSTPILGTEEAKIKVQAEPNQTIDIKTTGVGEAKISSEAKVEIYTPEHVSADINIHTDGAGSKINLASRNEVNITTPDVNVTGNVNATGTATVGGLVVNGDATFHGSVFQVNTEVITTSDNTIILNEGEQGQGVTAGTAGIVVDRGQLEDAKLLFDESDDKFKVGIGESLETIATQEWAQGKFAPAEHVGANGNAHAVATQSMAGFMSPEDKAKLDSIEYGANKYVHPTHKVCSYQYVHPTGDGNLHVPATGSDNGGKVLKAGNAPGSIGWDFVKWEEIVGRPGLASSQASGLMSAVDKAKLDTVLPYAEPNQNAFAAIKIGSYVVQAANKSDVFEIVLGEGIQAEVDTANRKVILRATAGGGLTRKVRVKPDGIVDGVNTVFTLPEDIVEDSEEVFVNGLLMNKGADNDYTMSGRTITFNAAPEPGSVILVSYCVA